MTAQLLPVPPPAVQSREDGGPGRVVVRVSVRSASAEVIHALEADLHAFIIELSAGALHIHVCGVCMCLYASFEDA